MDIQEANKRIDELRALLWENSRRYYVENAPTMSDFEFDARMHELEALEAQFPELITPDSPTQKVGSDLEDGAMQGGFAQYPHRYPMLSLGNTYNIEDIEAFVQRAEKVLEGSEFTYSCELKFDGTAICLNYRDGVLYRALTRGDGIVGDDVTRNVRRIKNIPERLSGNGWPSDFEIRGEILMPYEAFDRLNQEREEQEEQPFANPRNAASGSLKLSSPAEVARRGLWCTLYHIPAESLTGADGQPLFATHKEALDAAASWGLPVSDDRRICHDIAEIEDYISHWDGARKTLPYATDGIVIKINELLLQRTLGFTAKSPRWAVAFKFQAERALTPLLSIDYQVGRTGTVTPVANLQPVLLSGTMVKRATLNNADQMALLDIREGDWVYVEKGGEIIPKITGIELARRPQGAQPPVFPKTCPDCGTPLLRDEGEARWYCPNSLACPMQIQGRLVHFMSRKAMNVLAGDMTVGQLYRLGLARTPADLYELSAMQLMALEGWKERSVVRFMDSLEKSKQVPFERVLYALGIRFVGETTARALARHFGDIDTLMSASVEDLLEVGDVGEVIARSVYDFMHDPAALDQIARLRASGLRFTVEAPRQALSGALDGQTIVISGNFSISRDAMKELITLHGGKPSSSISAKTAFLLAGEKPGPEKLRKASELGVKVIGEDEFRAMLPEEGLPVDAGNDNQPLSPATLFDKEPTLFD